MGFITKTTFLIVCSFSICILSGVESSVEIDRDSLEQGIEQIENLEQALQEDAKDKESKTRQKPQQESIPMPLKNRREIKIQNLNMDYLEQPDKENMILNFRNKIQKKTRATMVNGDEILELERILIQRGFYPVCGWVYPILLAINDCTIQELKYFVEITN